jgi:hypothetical protein
MSGLLQISRTAPVQLTRHGVEPSCPGGELHCIVSHAKQSTFLAKFLVGVYILLEQVPEFTNSVDVMALQQRSAVQGLPPGLKTKRKDGPTWISTP